MQLLDECVQTKERLEWWIKECRKAGIFGFDTETTGFQVIEGKDTAVGWCLALSRERGCYIPVGHRTTEPQLDFDYVLEALAPILEDPKLVKVAANAAFDLNVCAMLGVNVRNIEDTQLQSYALDTQKYRARGHSFDALTKFHLNYDSIHFDDVVIGELGIKNFSYVRLDHATKYASEDARLTLALYLDLKQKLADEGLDAVYEDIDRPLPRIVADMRRRGIGLNMERVRELHTQWCAEADVLQDKIDKAVGCTLNLNSPKQLSEYLFDTLGLPVISETDSGGRSTDDDTLAALAKSFPEHVQLSLIREWKELSKLTSGFTGSWLEKVGADQRLHGDFTLTTTNTRRLASKDPNLQNIPT